MNDTRKYAGRLTFGMLVLCMGVTFLMNTLGKLPWDAWGEIAKWWPVLIIVAGINVIFEKSSAWAVTLISPLIVTGVFVWVIASYSYPDLLPDGASIRNLSAKSSETVHTVLAATSKDPLKVEKLAFEASTGAADIKISGKPMTDLGSMVKIVAESGTPAPEIEEKDKGTTYKVELSRKPKGTGINSAKESYHIELANDYPGSIILNTGACDAEIDLSGMKIDGLEINSGAADIEVILPDTGGMSMSVNSGATSLTLKVPEGVVVEIKKNGLIDIESDGLENLGSGKYVNGVEGDYPVVKLEVNAAFGSLTLESFASEGGAKQDGGNGNEAGATSDSQASLPVTT